ncbi:NAD(P)/FAD-dependent oxidoreductase [Pseudonocardia nigra]|uniref:NAD(P)/FAD-dependent oxidoreductase n=1 Tax=Pseudonocardia nigra TaxID=1921578 RepID=UPI001C604826|nr:NAD(P)/FAD-dependent oxidoreductase [Pseudonocardia nigra]
MSGWGDDGTSADHDVIVVGGGPAGLSAAIWLGRYRRNALVLDGGRYRNRGVEQVHGVLANDPAQPQELLQRGREELARYASVSVRSGQVSAVRKDEQDLFRVELDGTGGVVLAHRVVLATGVRDVFPQVEGFFEHYGADVFRCPTCDEFDARGECVAVFGWAQHVAGFAMELLDWAAEVRVITNGERFEGGDEQRAALAGRGVEIIEDRVVELVGPRGGLSGVRLASGRQTECTMGFFSIAHEPETSLARQLGCATDDEGYVSVDEHQQTSVAGVFAAGDVTPGMQLVNVAVGEGTVAGVSCALSLPVANKPAAVT